jgi:hypothetical protein
MKIGSCSNITGELTSFLLNSKFWWATSIFLGGQVKFEIMVAHGQPHHFWISETLFSKRSGEYLYRDDNINIV